MIQNVVFDMGQVLIHWSPSLFVQALDLSEGERVLLAREVYGKEEWARLDFGDISEEEAIAAISLRVPPQLRQYVPRLVQDWWGLCLKPMAGMSDFVRDLKKNGKGVYLLSNAARSVRKNFSRIPASECFDGLYFSAENLLVKPQKEIYESFLRRFSLDADTCFFIDDRLENVEGAAKAGIRGTVFDGDVEKLRRTAQQYQIL